MEKFNQAPVSSEVEKEEGKDVPVIDEELRLITSQLEMVDDKIANIDPRIQRGGPNSVTREVNLRPEDAQKINEETADWKAVREDLNQKLEEYYKTRTNQLEKEVKEEVESTLRKVLPNAIKGGGRELGILRSNGDIHPQILLGLNTDALSKLSRKKIEIMRKLYDPTMREGEFISLLFNPIKDRILESQEASPAINDPEASGQGESMERREFTDEELTDIVRNKLAYQDAELPPEQLEAMARDAEGRTTAKEYARHLSTLPEDKLSEVVPEIKARTQATLEAYGMPVSPFGKSDSWVNWDLGKQQYYYERNKDSEPEEGNPYTYAPALEKLDEISDRHIGWEFYHAPAEAREKALESIDDSSYLARVFEVLQNDPKADGQLPSHEYAELGIILREYARSKELKDSTEQDLNISEQDINFENNDDILLADRLSNPEINEQLVKLKYQLLKKEYDFYQNEEWKPYLPEGWTGEERFKLLKGKNSGKIIDTEDLNKKLSEPEPTLESVTKDITESIDEIRTVTHIDFETEEPDSERMGLGWEMPWTGEKPNTKQMSIINAHEKGHRVRSFYDGYTEMLRSAFDVSRVNFTEQDLEFLQKSREQSNKLVEGEKMSFEEERDNYLENYLFTGKEIAERMSQLKNYFGFAGNEQFTKKHLDYARKNYIKDTNMDNSMRLFFEAITPETEDDFLRLINNTGI